MVHMTVKKKKKKKNDDDDGDDDDKDLFSVCCSSLHPLMLFSQVSLLIFSPQIFSHFLQAFCIHTYNLSAYTCAYIYITLAHLFKFWINPLQKSLCHLLFIYFYFKNLFMNELFAFDLESFSQL